MSWATRQQNSFCEQELVARFVVRSCLWGDAFPQEAQRDSVKMEELAARYQRDTVNCELREEVLRQGTAELRTHLEQMQASLQEKNVECLDLKFELTNVYRQLATHATETIQRLTNDHGESRVTGRTAEHGESMVTDRGDTHMVRGTKRSNTSRPSGASSTTLDYTVEIAPQG